MTPIPYLTFRGTCREAMTFYADVFGGEIDMMMKPGDAPDFDVPPGKEDWVMHTGLQFEGGGAIFASDDMFGDAEPMQGSSIHMAFPTAEEGRVAFEKLAEGGEVRMPYGETFWTPGFGTLRDRFGINWMISTNEHIS